MADTYLMKPIALDETLNQVAENIATLNTTMSQLKGVGIEKIEKTSTVGLVDTYTITMTDGTTTTFTVTNGKDGSKFEPTTAQQAAMDSGITADKVSKMVDLDSAQLITGPKKFGTDGTQWVMFTPMTGATTGVYATMAYDGLTMRNGGKFLKMEYNGSNFCDGFGYKLNNGKSGTVYVSIPAQSGIVALKENTIQRSDVKAVISDYSIDEEAGTINITLTDVADLQTTTLLMDDSDDPIVADGETNE